MKRTHQPTKKDIKREWHLIDAQGKILGRMASEIANLLIGKHKVNYVPHFDMGDHVIVINAKDVEVTGNKMKKKIYYRHSGYPGGFRELRLEQLMDKDPRKVVELAVKRMLPKNRLQDPRMRRLRISIDGKHDYEDKFKEKSKRSRNSKNSKTGSTSRSSSISKKEAKNLNEKRSKTTKSKSKKK